MNQELKPENYKGLIKHRSKRPKEDIERKIKNQFIEIIRIIKKSRINAFKSINAELINLYWRIGEYISKKLERAEWGEGVVTQLATYIQTTYPEFKGYSDKNLWRMNQFYDTYKKSKLSALLRQLNWTNNLLILSKTKSEEVVKYALKRNMSPALISEYKTKLISKKMLQNNCMSCLFKKRRDLNETNY